MGRLWSVIAFAAIVATGTGCSGTGWWKKSEWNVPAMSTPTPIGSGTVKSDGVVQAGGSSPLSTMPSSLSWLTGKADKSAKAHQSVALVIPAWRNKIDYLADQTRDYAMGPGLAGQLFVFGPGDQPAMLDGKITVDLFDETPRQPGARPADAPMRWEFTKDKLANLRSTDERFGPCYVLFLPWREYRPDVTHVRIAVRYTPDQGYPIVPEHQKIAIDNSIRNSSATSMTLPMNSPHLSGLLPAAGTTVTTGPPPVVNHGPGPGLGAIRMGGRGPQTDSASAPAGATPAIFAPTRP